MGDEDRRLLLAGALLVDQLRQLIMVLKDSRDERNASRQLDA
jgi:hypothetical protein